MLRTGSAPAIAQRPRFGDSWTRTGWWAMAVPSFLSGSWAIFVSIAYPEMSAYYARMFAVPAIAFAHTAGGGVEWMFMPNWSGKLEYLYYDLGSVASPQTALSGAGATGPWAYTASTSARFNGHIVRAGLNYHFNWASPSPVVAKY